MTLIIILIYFQRNFSPAETNLSRSIVMTIGTYYLCRMLNLNIEYKSQKSWSLLIQRHASFIIQGFVFAGVQFFMPLGIVHTLGSCGPIFTIILQRILRKDNTFHITGRKLNGCVIALIGIILTSNGKFIYSYFDESFQFESQFLNYSSSSSAIIIIATVVLIGSQILSSYGVLITQQAGCHAFQMVFHFAVSNLIFSSLSYLFLEEKRPAGELYESLIWVGVFLFFAQICFTLSLNLSENLALTNMASFFNVVIGYGIGILRYGQTIDAVSLIGTLFVIAGVSIIILIKSQNEKKCRDGQQTLENSSRVKNINTSRAKLLLLKFQLFTINKPYAKNIV